MLFGVLEEIHVFDADKVKVVMQELSNETSGSDAVMPDIEIETKIKEKKSARAQGAKRSQSAAKAAAAQAALPVIAEGDVAGRLAQLEQRVINLEEALRREAARLRRAILLSDDFGDIE